MADLNLERKRGPLLWPWLVGLVVLALLIWGIAELVNTDRDNQQMAQADSAGAATADGSGAGAAPAGGQAAPAAEQTVGVTPLGALVPLGIQHAGQRVMATGQVLSKPANGGFWLRSEGNALVWVKSSLSVKQGQQAPDLTGTLERARPADVQEWMKELPAEVGKGAVVTSEVYLDAGGESAAATPAGKAGKAGAPATAKTGKAPARARVKGAHG